METEYEATFYPVEKENMRKKLKEVGAKLVREEFFQRRFVFDVPNADRWSWVRVRDEGDKVTMSFKKIENEASSISDQKEIMLIIDNFDKGVEFLEIIKCKKKAYQETLREIWEKDGVEITIDTWPFLEPFVEVESSSEERVKKISEVLGFEWKDAIFNSADYIYSKVYDVSTDFINDELPELKFDMENPFEKKA